MPDTPLPSQPPASTPVSNSSMRRARTIVLLIMAFLSLVLSAAASPCLSQAATDKASSKSHHTKPAAQTGKEQSEPCDKTIPKPVESQTSGEVGWDPVVCWDCPTPGEVPAFFFVGLVLCAPMFILIRRVRTRKLESAKAHRFLE